MKKKIFYVKLTLYVTIERQNENILKTYDWIKLDYSQ